VAVRGMSPPTQGGRWPPRSLGVTMTYADDLETHSDENELDDDELDDDEFEDGGEDGGEDEEEAVAGPISIAVDMNDADTPAADNQSS